MSEYIPLEIQAEILKRLPLKPLIQFRTVSKSYKSLIDRPGFIVSYYVHHQPLQPDDRFILRYKLSWTGYPGQERYITFVDNGDSFVQQEFIPPVPDLIKTLKPSSENFCNLNIDNVFGFGVCPVTFDPTILKITSVAYMRNRNDMSRIRVPWKVRAFTLSTGTWSILSANLPRDSVRLRGSQVIIDRFIYWVAYDVFDPEDSIDAEEALSHSRFLIVSFDLTVKEFKEISLTGSLTNFRCMIRSISKLRESLVLLAYHFEEEVSACWYLWMMKEQGVSRSFTKLYTIKVEDALIRKIVGFRKTGELIMEIIHKNKKTTDVQIYELNNEYAENLGIDGKDFSFFMCSYMETLLLLDKSDGYIYPPIVRI